MTRSKTKKAVDSAKAAASPSHKNEERAGPTAGVAHVTPETVVDAFPTGRQICLEDVHAAMRRASSEVNIDGWAQNLLENHYVKQEILRAASLRREVAEMCIPRECHPEGMNVYGKTIHINGLEIRASVLNRSTPWVHIQWPSPT